MFRQRKSLVLARLGVAAALVAATTTGAALTAPAQATPVSNASTVFNTDWTSAGVGGVGAGGGTITLAGVSGTVTKALLYWHGIDSGGAGETYDASTITFAGSPAPGTSLGDANTNCWGAGSSRAYRADVTSLVSGNGAFTVSGLESGPSEDANGLSLVVFFNDGDATNNRDVVLFEGNDSNYNQVDSFPGEDEGWHATLAGINYTAGTASLQLHVGDGQEFADGAVAITGGLGTPLNIPDTTSLFDGNSVPSAGSSRAPNGDLWDIHSFDITTALGAGSNTLSLNSDSVSDCLSLVLAAIDLPAGAAPTEICGNGIDDNGNGQIDENCTTATTTTYTGDATVQYSDAATLSGHLVDAGNSAVSGKQLDFTVGTQNASASPTNASGNASTSLTLTQQPAALTVATSFAGDATYLTSSDSDAFTVTKEDCTLAYSGDTLVVPATNTTLSAQLGEPDTSLGDLSGKSVRFTVTNSSLVQTSYVATTNSSGVASTSQSLPSDVYGVDVTFLGDAFYLPCGTAADTLVTVQQAGAKVTGGGWFTPSGVSRTSFGVNLIPEAGGAYKGQFQLRANNSKSKFHGNTAANVVQLAANKVSWKGTGRWNGVTGYGFELVVVDNGSSGSKKLDTISVRIFRTATGQTVYTSGGASPLKGGNLTVH
jgi:hypothetical protein